MKKAVTVLLLLLLAAAAVVAWYFFREGRERRALLDQRDAETRALSEKTATLERQIRELERRGLESAERLEALDRRGGTRK